MAERFRRVRPSALVPRDLAARVNELQAAVEALLAPRGGGGLNVTTRPGGLLLSDPDDVPEGVPGPVWLRIDGAPASAGRYESWTEQADDGAGGFETPGDPMTGSADFPAWLVAGAAPAVGDVVLAWWSEGRESLLFEGPSGSGGALTVQGSTGSPLYSGVDTLVADQSNGLLSLSQPGAGQAELTVNPGAAGAAVELARAVASFTRPILPPPEDESSRLLKHRVFNRPTLPPTADPDASLTVRGYVSLTNQSMGNGDKYFAGKVGIGTTNPLANIALDVRGQSVYLAGDLYFRGGNSPASETDGVALTSDGSSYISLSKPGGSAGDGKAHSLKLNVTGARLELHHNSAASPQIGFFNDDTSAFVQVGGMSVGGAVSGGTGGDLLGTDGSGNLQNVNPNDANLMIGNLVFAP